MKSIDNKYRKGDSDKKILSSKRNNDVTNNKSKDNQINKRKEIIIQSIRSSLEIYIKNNKDITSNIAIMKYLINKENLEVNYHIFLEEITLDVAQGNIKILKQKIKKNEKNKYLNSKSIKRSIIITINSNKNKCFRSFKKENIQYLSLNLGNTNKFLSKLVKDYSQDINKQNNSKINQTLISEVPENEIKKDSIKKEDLLEIEKNKIEISNFANISNNIIVNNVIDFENNDINYYSDKQIDIQSNCDFFQQPNFFSNSNNNVF